MKITKQATNKLKKLEKTREEYQAMSTKQFADLEKQTDEILWPIFEKSKDLAKDLKSLEESQNWQFNECGDLDRWARMTFDLKIFDLDDAWGSLSRYLSDQGIYLDKEHDILLTSGGAHLILNEDNDVYDQDSGKFIVSKQDWQDNDGRQDENKLHDLLEAWREKNGYFPALFRADHYGNVYLTKL